MVDLTGLVAADSTQPVDPDPRIAQAQNLAVDALTTAVADTTLRDTTHDALVNAYAEGQAGAGQLVSVTTGQVGVDLTQLSIDFADAVTAAGNLDDLWADADQWIADHIGVVSRAVGDAVGQALVDGTSRADLLSELLGIIDDPDSAAVLYDHALATALDQGAADLYASEGLTHVEVITAGDSRVDEICQGFETHGPYLLTDAPSLPAHVGCRCALAPSDDAIRALLSTAG